MTGFDRRALFLAMAGLPLATAATGADAPGQHDMGGFPASWTKHEQIAMLLYPRFTALDLVGPQYYLQGLLGSRVHLVAKTLDPVTSDTGLSIVPTATFEACPADLDILFVPGGTAGTVAAMSDQATLAFVADRGARAKWVSSVCTGSMLLGAAGLLRGYRATSHWATWPLLTEFGAIPVDERVVVDRNRLTGAGVTAGLDLGLRFDALLRDEEYARCMQLLSEYDPQPMFDAGTPRKAPHERTMLQGMLDGFVERARIAAAASPGSVVR